MPDSGFSRQYAIVRFLTGLLLVLVWLIFLTSGRISAADFVRVIGATFLTPRTNASIVDTVRHSFSLKKQENWSGFVA